MITENYLSSGQVRNNMKELPHHEPKTKTYTEFWDFYVAEHAQPLTRYLHFIGTTLGLILLVWILRGGHFMYLPLCFVIGYFFAWTSHFFVEHNKPATFKYPLWSFISDYKMVWFMMTGRMNREVERVSNK
ncbi:MAG: Mpo1-like protein [Pyrinomonadaceae bacterium]